jgi:hypothetical protein
MILLERTRALCRFLEGEPLIRRNGDTGSHVLAERALTL